MDSLQAVIFDLDDTLYPERQYVRSGYRAVAQHLTETPGSGEQFQDWLWERFCQGQAAGAFDAMSERFDLGLSAEQIGKLVTVYRQHVPDIRAFDSVPDLLGRLGGSYKLGLLSDGFLPAQRLKLEALGLERFFHAIVFTEEMGREYWKPSPAGFEKISQLLGAPPEACCYVSDNPAKDFVAPNALGWLAVQYIRPGQVHADKPAPSNGRPQVVVHDDDELCRALQRCA